MATQISHQLSAVAGKATNPLNPVAKAAQKQLATVIRKKKEAERQRLQAQEAIRQTVRRQGRDTRRPGADSDHGRHIWIYKHRGTNQVVYSLTQELKDNRALRQLTFVGKKSVPASIRQDLWDPFAIVTFPTPPQGLEAYRYLREFRLRHEHEWREHIDSEVLPPREERKRMLQNQKANSVADLAATLALQQRLANERVLEGQKRIASDEKQLNHYKQEAAKLDEALEEAKAKLEKSPEANEADRQSIQKEIDEVVKKRATVYDSRAQYTRRVEAAQAASKASNEMADEMNLSIYSAKENELSPHAAFTERMQVQLTPRYLAEGKAYPPMPKRGGLRQQMVREILHDRIPIPTMEGVKIMWAIANDREYAQSWPEAVEHEVMGVRAGEAPDPVGLRKAVEDRATRDERVAKFEAKTEAEMDTLELAQWHDIKISRLLERRRALDLDIASGSSAVEEQGAQLEQEVDEVLLAQVKLAMQLAAKEEVSEERQREMFRLEAMDEPSMTDAELGVYLNSKITTVGRQLAALKRLQQRNSGRRYLNVDLLKPAIRDLKRKQRHLAWGSVRQKPRAVRKSKNEEGSSAAEPPEAKPESVMVKGIAKKVKQPRFRHYLQLAKFQDLNKSEQGLLRRALQSKLAAGKDLTPEEEEHMANIELDGESSGKGEDSAVDEEQSGDKEKSPEKEDADERKKQERERKRQEEESKKSLWGRLFGSSSSSNDSQPRA